MTIALASDHAGLRYKNIVKEILERGGHIVKDFGTDSEKPIDYPLVIRPAAEAVGKGRYEAGIIFGGSGNGEAMVANKVKGVRCAVCWNEESARLAREHNNANIISIGQRLVSEDKLLPIMTAWLEAKFEGGRHLRRIGQIER
jgi:ribose 5-phosphate isomerase B